MQFNDYLMRKTHYKTMRFLVYMYYMHSGYQTPIFGKNCAYYIRIFMVSKKIYTQELKKSHYVLQHPLHKCVFKRCLKNNKCQQSW